MCDTHFSFSINQFYLFKNYACPTKSMLNLFTGDVTNIRLTNNILSIRKPIVNLNFVIKIILVTFNKFRN